MPLKAMPKPDWLVDKETKAAHSTVKSRTFAENVESLTAARLNKEHADLLTAEAKLDAEAIYNASEPWAWPPPGTRYFSETIDFDARSASTRASNETYARLLEGIAKAKMREEYLAEIHDTPTPAPPPPQPVAPPTPSLLAQLLERLKERAAPDATAPGGPVNVPEGATKRQVSRADWFALDRQRSHA